MTLPYQLTLYDADGASDSPADAGRHVAERCFRRALDTTLGDAALVWPVYSAYLRIVATYGETPDPDALSDAELAVFTQWQAAEMAAITATFGPHRHLGDAVYEITPWAG